MFNKFTLYSSWISRFSGRLGGPGVVAVVSPTSPARTVADTSSGVWSAVSCRTSSLAACRRRALGETPWITFKPFGEFLTFGFIPKNYRLKSNWFAITCWICFSIFGCFGSQPSRRMKSWATRKARHCFKDGHRRATWTTTVPWSGNGVKNGGKIWGVTTTKIFSKTWQFCVSF